jgi:TRAP-type C4-dicarboxylate transport system permease small subunit
MTALGLIDRAIGYASGALAVIGAAAILVLMGHVVVDVSGRYFFDHPFAGTLEMSTYYYMVMVTALPFAYVTRTQGQITVEMFTNWMPRRWIYLFDIFGGIITLIYVGVLTWKTGQEAGTMTGIGEVHDAGAAQIITWPSRWIPPIAFGVMACAVALKLVQLVRSLFTPGTAAATTQNDQV